MGYGLPTHFSVLSARPVAFALPVTFVARMAPDLKEYSEDDVAKVRGCTANRPRKGAQKCVYLMTLTSLPFPFFALRGVSSTAQSKIAGW